METVAIGRYYKRELTMMSFVRTGQRQQSRVSSLVRQTLHSFYPSSSALLISGLIPHPSALAQRSFHSWASDDASKDFKSFLEPKIKAQAKRFAEHPLLTEWLAEESLLERGEAIFRYMSPLMIRFVMSLRDYNERHLRYEESENTTTFEKVINAHTRKNATHSQLFLQDLSSLGLNSLLGWTYSDYMRSIMASYDHNMKRQGLRLYHLAYQNQHPFARFALMEVIETAGKEFFSVTANLAEELAQMTGRPYHYFGMHHLALESGHKENEGVFFIAEQKPGLAIQAHHLTARYGQDHNSLAFRTNIATMVEQVGDVFIDMFNSWQEGAERLSNDRDFYRKISEQKVLAYLPKNKILVSNSVFNHSAEKIPSLFINEPMQNALHQIENHPLYNCLFQHSHNTGRVFAPFALVDLLETAFICRFNEWGCSGHHNHAPLLREMAATIGKMGDGLIQDWGALELNWLVVEVDTYQLLAFKFFDPRCDLHRKHFADWFQTLLKHNDPIVQCFILQATLDIYRSFLKKFTPCFGKRAQFSSLVLFNDRWFHDFQQKFHKRLKALESELTSQQKKIITEEVGKISQRFIDQLEAASQALDNANRANVSYAAKGLKMSKG